jgi:hypothetical protein
LARDANPNNFKAQVVTIGNPRGIDARGINPIILACVVVVAVIVQKIFFGLVLEYRFPFPRDGCSIVVGQVDRQWR